MHGYGVHNMLVFGYMYSAIIISSVCTEPVIIIHEAKYFYIVT